MLVEADSRACLQRLLAAWLPLLHGLRSAAGAVFKGVHRWALEVDSPAI